jgi:biopolymer transport protein ExbD
MARHYHRGTGDPPVEVILPITPMLDMSFQLLAFFVMTFQAANALEGQLDMYLPKAGNPQAKRPDQVDLSKDSDADLDQQADVAVVVSSQRGDVEGLAIREKTKSTPVADVKSLKGVLAKLRADLGGTQTAIKIEADGHLKYARLVDVMDACLGAGFRSVGFSPPPDLK